MRRIYESSALKRGDGHFAPQDEEEPDTAPRAVRTVSGSWLSKLLLPYTLRYRAISISVSTPRTEYPEGVAIPFVVEMHNAFPIPVTLPTESPLPWTWAVDGHPEAARVDVRDPPDWTTGYHFERSERKRFVRSWPQRFRVSDREWETADPGTYRIGAYINVDDPAARGLVDETTVRIVEDSSGR